jgi:hypothetical protein
VILRIYRSRATKLPGNPRFIKGFHLQFAIYRLLQAGKVKEPVGPRQILCESGASRSSFHRLKQQTGGKVPARPFIA